MSASVQAWSVAIPCRTDEPALAATLANVWREWEALAAGRAAAPLDIVVCLNGPDGAAGRAAGDVERFVAGHPESAVHVLRCFSAGKARAWNALRQHATRPLTIFADADVEIAPGTILRLLEALAAAPDAVLATPRTRCAPRPGLFESVMAAPYAVPFPNLSGQLYAARTAALPPAMPECLLEPERWLELVVGPERVQHVAAASVIVRLPATVRDFVRQRVRIEMGKVQLRRDFPGLLERSAPQPGARRAWRSLGLGALARLGVYLALREACHVAAACRHRSVEQPSAWPQATSTKEWPAQ
jgi:Glycosyl transferase family 2